MKIVVIGGAGLIGSKLVAKLDEQGHDAVPASPNSGVNTLTGAQVVVDVLDIFETSSRDLLVAETAAGVGHHVTLSVVGADRLPESGYFRAKVTQEEVVKAGPVPYTILRATQFFEFDRPDRRFEHGRRHGAAAARARPARSRRRRRSTLADIAVGAPVNGTVELAGPSRSRSTSSPGVSSSASDDRRR